MKALSLWQPWASAIACGAKLVETRSWYTKYRGPLAIHAASRLVKGEMTMFQCSWSWCAALEPMGFRMGDGKSWENELPFGAIVAVCDVVEVRKTESFRLGEIETPKCHGASSSTVVTWTERMLGDFSLGRYGWELSQIRSLPEPVPCRGKQGLFDLDADTAETIRAMLAEAAA